MCGNCNFDKKTRRLYVAANLCLVAGLMPIIMHLPLRNHHALSDGICGLLLGVSIGLFLFIRRCKNKPAPPANGQA